LSKTAELDETIRLLNEMLAKPKLKLKDKLAITDRLGRFYALKLKHDQTGKGGKFAAVPANGADDATGSSPEPAVN
jgi:hypothetical protein